MPTLIAYHEVDDADHWLASPKREEFFAPMGVTHRTFIDPQNRNRAAVIFEIPDLEAFEAALQTPEAAEAMQHDGVRPETLVVLAES